IIERAIELQFRQATRPLNVICFGYQQPQPNHTEMASTYAPYGLELTSPNSATRLLNSEAWMVLLSRVGDTFMLQFLLYTSIFYPLPNASYLQIAGVPISSLVSSPQSHELVRIGLVNRDTTEICKTSGFQTERAWSHLRNQCQLEDLGHKHVQLTCEAKDPSIDPKKMVEEMDKTVPVTRSTGINSNFHNSKSNRSRKYGYRRGCKGVHKRPFTSDHWTGRCKKRKANIDEIPFNTKKLLNSPIICKSGDSCKDGYSSKIVTPDFHHRLHMLTETKALFRWSKEHAERLSVELPKSFRCWNQMSPVHLWSSSKSDSAQHPFLHLKWSAKTDTIQRCSNLENITPEIHDSLSFNIGKKGGRLKKRSRLFSWQRRKMCGAQERPLSIENMEQSGRLKEGTSEDYTRNQQLQSPPYFVKPLENYSSVIGHGVRSQFASKNLLKEKVTRRTLVKALVSDKNFSVESNVLSLDGKEDGDQELGVLQDNKGDKLSISEDMHVREAGKVDGICLSSSCHYEGNRLVNANQNLCAIHSHAFNFERKPLDLKKDLQKPLFAGRKCMCGACNLRSQKNDNILEAIYELQTQPTQKNQQMFCLDKSHVSESLYSQLIANSANPVAFKENAKPKHQCLLLSNTRKFSCRCLCWLMAHTRHLDAANTLIGRRRLFYNSKFLHHGGFPLNHILNVIKPRISDAKQLLAIIFGIPDSCLHEKIIDRDGVSESLC
ncbi:hypothetical protein KI387_037099, partial [Taxus chinensis]